MAGQTVVRGGRCSTRGSPCPPHLLPVCCQRLLNYIAWIELCIAAAAASAGKLQGCSSSTIFLAFVIPNQKTSKEDPST